MRSLVMGPTEWALLILLSLLWGGSFFFVELALVELEPFTVVLGRVGFAAAALLGFVALSGHRMPREPAVWGAFLVMGGLNNLIPFSLITWGQVHIDSGLTSILNATTPLFTVVLAHFLTSDERMTPNRLTGVLVGLVGVVILIGPEALSGFGLQAYAQLAILGAALFYGLSGIYGRRLSSLPSPVAAAGMLTGSTVMMVPLAFILEDPLSASPALLTWAAVLGLSLLSTALAYMVYFRILAAAGATNLLLVTFLIPPSALLLGVFVLGEPLSWTALAGMALIFCGLAAVDGRALGLLRRMLGMASPESGSPIDRA